MIYRQKKLITIGSLVKTHGVQGAMVLRLIQGYNPSILNKSNYCFLNIRNKPVPFKLEEVQESNLTDIIVQLDSIASKPDAEDFLNYQLSIERKTPIRKKKTDNILLLIGYSVYNAGKLIGTVINIENHGKQFLLVLEDELLIPAHDDLIESIDDAKKTIYMKLPDGLV